MRLQGALVMLLLAGAPTFAEDPGARLLEAEHLLGEKRFAEAAEAFEGYLHAHPKGQDRFRACAGAFDAHLAGGDDAGAQAAGKRLFEEYPDAKGTFPVLSRWIEKGWEVPHLATSYDVLRFWTFDRVDGSRKPDLRLALLDVIERQHRRSDLVKDGGILYCRAWCHLTAGRQDEAIALGQRYLRTKSRGDYADRTRVVVAQALLACDPPRTEEATKLIRALAQDEESPQHAHAKELLLQAGAGPPPIQITRGFPTAEGLGRMVVLTNLPASHAHRKAVAPWVAARDAEVVAFRGRDVQGAAGRLRKRGAEYVAVLIEPGDLDNDFQLAMLELCRGLDRDPLPDFHYGYLVARDAEDLAALTARILEKERTGGSAAREVPLPKSGAELEGLDLFLHYGHGTARGIDGGLSANQVAALTLTASPVVVSGACYNGVTARTFERGFLGNHFGEPDELAPDEVLSLAWIHAGASALLAALDGDRGEMAGAEWEHLREHAPPLGAVIGYEYRLVFTSLPQSFEAFPRYEPGARKDKSFYAVMLRGQTSRILISDPMYRPLHAPVAQPTTRTSVEHDAEGGTVTVRVEMLRRSNGPFVNTLPTKAGTPFRETRLYARVALPEGFEETLAFPRSDAGGVELSRVQAKHEVWGGRRFVNLQAESADWKLTAPGAVTTFVMDVVR